MAETVTKLPIKTSTTPTSVETWAPLDNLRREIDRLFDAFHPFGWRMPSRFLDLEIPRLSHGAFNIAPAVDWVAKDDGYEVTAELPGLDEKNVEIKLSNHTLTIKGEKSEQKEDKQKDYYLSERSYGAFQRSFQLPDDVDMEKIDAHFTKGVLTVKLPKTAEAKKAERKIAVKPAA